MRLLLVSYPSPFPSVSIPYRFNETSTRMSTNLWVNSVSIPYRFNETRDSGSLVGDATSFQFLIGSMRLIRKVALCQSLRGFNSL